MVGIEADEMDDEANGYEIDGRAFLESLRTATKVLIVGMILITALLAAADGANRALFDGLLPMFG